MRKLSRFSEQYQATGNVAGEGVLNLLGRPDLQPLELLVREALQNSWDAAAAPNKAPVRVTVQTSELDDRQMSLLTSRVLVEPPRRVPLASSLRESPRLLHISDRGTIGLGGPTRADEITNGPTDFVDFVRNIGQPPDREHGGGSYGYGKGAFFLSSRAHVVVIYTRTKKEGGRGSESRFMAAALSEHGNEKLGSRTMKLTGRHWWGRMRGKVIEPLVGDEADELASKLGIPGFGRGERGTTVSIVAPELELVGEANDGSGGGGTTPREAFEFMARAIGWHFWPKLMGDDPAMTVSLVVDGEHVPVPRGQDDPRLALFESANRLLETGEHPPGALRASIEEIHSLKPKKRLGRLAIVLAPIAGQRVPSAELSAPEATTTLRHAALMRQAELVVKYLPGPEMASGQVGYAAVFKCEEDLDSVFRDSEPPSHDDWIPDHLSDRTAQRFVRVARRRISDKLAEFVEGVAPSVKTSEEVPLGRFAKELGDLILGLAGTGARPSPPKPRGAGRKPVLEVRQPAHLVMDGGQRYIEATVRPTKRVTVTANPRVATAEGIESDPPAGAKLPEVLSWTNGGGSSIDGPTANLKGKQDWTVRVTSPADAAIRIDFEVDG